MSKMAVVLKNFLRKYVSSIIIGLFVINAVGWWQSKDMTQGPLPLALLDSDLITLEGQQVKVWSHGKLTLLYVFAPWCGACQISASNVNNLDSNQRRTIALALSWKDQESVQTFLDNSGLTTPVILGTEEVAGQLGLQVFPSYYLINEQGEITKSWSGYTTRVGLILRTKIAEWF